MSSKQPILWAKLVAMLAFLVLLSTVYMLRGEALTLARIGFSADKAKAEFKDGVLRVNLAKSEKARPKQIEVKVS